MLTNRKNKHYRAADDDEFDERRPLKIQKLMMMKKQQQRDDQPPPPPPYSIRRKEEEEEESMNSSSIGVRSVRMMTAKEKEEEILEVPWDVLTPQVLQLIANRMKLFDYCGEESKPVDVVVIQLDLGGGTVSNVPLTYTR